MMKRWGEMSRAERHRDRLRHFPTMLERWQGGDGSLWGYTVSLRNLSIRIQRAGVRGNLHIACVGLVSIQSPAEWHNANIQIDVADDSEDSQFVVTDSENGVRIVTDIVEVKENVNPIYMPDARNS